MLNSTTLILILNNFNLKREYIRFLFENVITLVNPANPHSMKKSIPFLVILFFCFISKCFCQVNDTLKTKQDSLTPQTTQPVPQNTKQQNQNSDESFTKKISF